MLYSAARSRTIDSCMTGRRARQPPRSSPSTWCAEDSGWKRGKKIWDGSAEDMGWERVLRPLSLSLLLLPRFRSGPVGERSESVPWPSFVVRSVRVSLLMPRTTLCPSVSVPVCPLIRVSAGPDPPPVEQLRHQQGRATDAPPPRSENSSTLVHNDSPRTCHQALHRWRDLTQRRLTLCCAAPVLRRREGVLEGLRAAAAHQGAVSPPFPLGSAPKKPPSHRPLHLHPRAREACESDFPGFRNSLVMYFLFSGDVQRVPGRLGSALPGGPGARENPGKARSPRKKSVSGSAQHLYARARCRGGQRACGYASFWPCCGDLLSCLPSLTIPIAHTFHL